MNIKEIRTKRNQLELRILDLTTDFERECDASVAQIGLITIQTTNLESKPQTKIIGVDVEIKL